MKKKKPLKEMSLPSNRKESILDILKNQSFNLLKIGLVILLFSSPYLIVLFIRNISLNELKDVFIAGIINSSEYSEKFFKTNNTFNLINIWTFSIIGVGFAGVSKIIKNLIWQKDVFFFYDLKSGIKENFKTPVIFTTLFGAFRFTLDFLRYSGNDSTANKITLAIIIAVLFLTIMIGAVAILQSSIYNLSFKEQIKNAFILLFLNFINLFIATLILIVPWLILIFDLSTYYLLVQILLIVIFAPIEILIFAEIAFDTFDNYINKTHHPDIYKKGIWENGTNQNY